MVVGVVAVGAAAMEASPHGALISEGGRGKTVKHPKVWVVPGGHVCLTAGTSFIKSRSAAADRPSTTRRARAWFGLGTKAHYSAGALVFNHRSRPYVDSRLTYTQAQWGGSGGDGILVFLQNGDAPMKFGTGVLTAHKASYLGYTPRNCCTATGLPQCIGGDRSRQLRRLLQQ